MANNFEKESAKLEKVKLEVSETLKAAGIEEMDKAEPLTIVAALEAGLGKIKPVAIAKAIKYIAVRQPAFMTRYAEILRILIKQHLSKIANGDVKPIFEPLPGAKFDQTQYNIVFTGRAEAILKAEAQMVVQKGLYYVEGWVNKEQVRESK